MNTNDLQQVTQTVVQAKSELSALWIALAPVMYIIGREIRAFNAWAKNVAEWIISHGGVVYLAWKLIWNPGGKAAAIVGLILLGASSAPAQQFYQPVMITPLLNYGSFSGTNATSSMVISNCSVPPTSAAVQTSGLPTTNSGLATIQLSLDNTNFINYTTAPIPTNAGVTNITPDLTQVKIYFRVVVGLTNSGTSVGVQGLNP